jgi:adenylate cyclase
MAEARPIKPAPRRATALIGACALITLLLLTAHLFNLPPLVDAEHYVQDWFQRLGRRVAPDPRLVLVGIDRPSYAQDILPAEAEADPVLAALRGNFPWSRTVWAVLIEKLATAGAKAIVIDLVFANPGDGDDALQQVIAKHKDKVVIAWVLNHELTDRGTNWIMTVPHPGIVSAPAEKPVALDERVGLVNVWGDSDGVLRRAHFQVRNSQLHDVINAAPDAVAESLGARALRMLGESGRVPNGFEPRRFRYTAARGVAYELYPIGDLLSAKAWQENFKGGEFFRDKLVLIGPTANIFQDFHLTPFREKMAGPEVHLNIINAALRGEFIRELPPALGGLFIALAGLVAGALCRVMRQPVKRLAIAVALGAAYLLLTYALFNNANLAVPAVTPLLVLITCALAALAWDFIVERLERMKLRHTMGLYFSPRVLEEVLADPGSMNPRRADVTLLLTDLRNSTPLAEALGPKGMFDLLNRVFEAQTTAIMGEEGNLEHFLGDQFLSYWGAPQSQPDAAVRAERAAQKLIAAMEELRASLNPDVQKLFGYGVALHSGGVLVGNKGSAMRLDYGLVGDTVNEAARIEALTKEYGIKLLVSGDTFAQLSASPEGHRLVDRVIVKGKTEPVELFECENPCVPPNYPALCERYTAAFAEYAAGRFTEAKAQFEKLVDDFADGPSRLLAARCARLLATPPTDWNGVWKMESK